MPPPEQRFSATVQDREPLADNAGKWVPVALSLTGIAIVAMNPGNGLVVGAVVTALVSGFYFTAGGSAPARTQVPEKIVEEHKLLVESIQSAPIPFAVYDRDDYLIVCNKSYEDLYGDVFDTLRSRIPGRRLHYADLVRGFAADTVPPDEIDAYVDQRCRAQRAADGTGVDRYYSGFGWLQVTKFATPGGAVAGFAVDINELKRRETALHAQIDKSKVLQRELRALANTDPLTELSNRRAFFERLESEYARARRYQNPLSVIMLDIDRFKAVNDVYGHSVGDAVITRLASTAGAELRANVDLIGRVGGEEFAILLPATDGDGARECAERIRKSIAALEFQDGDDKLRVTASFGVTAMMPDDRSASECITRADGALYQAKSLGRNRVVVGGEKPA